MHITRFNSPLFPRRGYHDEACDDRGQPIQSLRHNQLAQCVDRDSRRFGALKTRLQMIGQCDRPPAPGRRTNPQTWIVLGCVITISIYAMGINYAGFSGDHFIIWMFAIIWVAFYLSQRFKRSETRTITAMTLVAEGVCGECGFLLDGLSPEHDGCLVCPECGHAWYALRVTRPYREPSDDIDKPKRDPRPDVRAGARLRDPRRWGLDDCARCVHTPDRRLSELLPDEREMLGPQYHEIRGDISRMTRVHRAITMLIACALSTLLIIRLGLPEFNESVWKGLLVIILFLAPITIAVVVCAMATWIHPHRVVCYLTSRGYCGSCVNNLSDVVPDANMMRVCDRCRASWLDARFPAANGTTAAGS